MNPLARSSSTSLPRTSSLLDKLRHATTEIHDRLHGNPRLTKLLNAHFSLQNYLCVLSAFYKFHLGAETFFRDAKPRFEHEARCLSWLKRDLHFFGHSIPCRAESLADTRTILPSFDSYIGYLYVKQGSTLGAQVLGNAIRRHRLSDAGEGMEYFNGFGRDTAARWRDFIDFLSDHEKYVNEEQAAASARHFFLDIEYQLNQNDQTFIGQH